jgi:hypothetical protein
VDGRVVRVNSLRTGFVTEAAGNGAGYPSNMERTGQVTFEAVHGYYQQRPKMEEASELEADL